jgi:predicted nucleotidyltransferase/Uma2 family endonuclease
MTTWDNLQKKKPKIRALASRYGVEKVRIFGSVARNEDRHDSDVDFLVDLKPETSLLDLGGFLMDLQDLLGKRVDVVTEDSLHWYIRERFFGRPRPYDRRRRRTETRFASTFRFASKEARQTFKGEAHQKEKEERKKLGEKMSTVHQRATLDDLYRTEGKAELIGGRIVNYMATGVRPSEVASNIYVGLRGYAKKRRKGKAFNDNLGYAIPELPSGRESFSPDASYYDGPLPKNLMRFIKGPPKFAAEVRSENDYTQTAEEEIAAKRMDYFAAGTLVVWDVDPVAETIQCYHGSQPDQPVVFRKGDVADAEPACPGWRISVDDVFA